MGKVVQHHKNILNPLPDLLRGVASHEKQIVTPLSNWPQQRQLRAGAIKKINLITKKWRKSALNEKVCFFPFSHFNNFFGTRGKIQAIFNFLEQVLSLLSHSQSPQHSKTYLQCLETKLETHFILWQSWGNLFSLQLKRPKFCHF